MLYEPVIFHKLTKSCCSGCMELSCISTEDSSDTISSFTSLSSPLESPSEKNYLSSSSQQGRAPCLTQAPHFDKRIHMHYHHIMSDAHSRYFCSLFSCSGYKMNVRLISINELIYSEAPFTEQHAIALLQVYFLGYKVATFTHKQMVVPTCKSQK